MRTCIQCGNPANRSYCPKCLKVIRKAGLAPVKSKPVVYFWGEKCAQ